MQQHPPGSGLSRAQITRGKNRLAKTGEIKEALGRQTYSFLDRTGYADPPPWRVLRSRVLGAAPRLLVLSTQRIPRATLACIRIQRGATGQAPKSIIEDHGASIIAVSCSVTRMKTLLIVFCSRRCWCTNQLLGVGRRQLSLSVRRCAAIPPHGPLLAAAATELHKVCHMR